MQMCIGNLGREGEDIAVGGGYCIGGRSKIGKCGGGARFSVFWVVSIVVVINGLLFLVFLCLFFSYGRILCRGEGERTGSSCDTCPVMVDYITGYHYDMSHIDIMT